MQVLSLVERHGCFSGFCKMSATQRQRETSKWHSAWAERKVSEVGARRGVSPVLQQCTTTTFWAQEVDHSAFVWLLLYGSEGVLTLCDPGTEWLRIQALLLLDQVRRQKNCVCVRIRFAAFEKWWGWPCC